MPLARRRPPPLASPPSSSSSYLEMSPSRPPASPTATIAKPPALCRHRRRRSLRSLFAHALPPRLLPSLSPSRHLQPPPPPPSPPPRSVLHCTPEKNWFRSAAPSSVVSSSRRRAAARRQPLVYLSACKRCARRPGATAPPLPPEPPKEAANLCGCLRSHWPASRLAPVEGVPRGVWCSRPPRSWGCGLGWIGVGLLGADGRWMHTRLVECSAVVVRACLQ